MELIKNLGVGRHVTSSKNFCPKCNNRGRIKIVKACDREKFDREFDRLDAPGTMSMDLVYDKAIEGCQFDYYYCPDCEEGQKYKDKYPMYGDAVSYIAERDKLYDALLGRKLELRDAEEKELQIMKSYLKENHKELDEAQKNADELSQKYAEARKQFMDFVKKYD